MKTFKICVTQEDIDKGECRNGSKCAIARALLRVFDGLEVLVSGTGIFFKRRAESGRIMSAIALHCPFEAQEFIELYDVNTGHGKLFVEPFEFELVMTDEAYEQLTGKELIQLDLSDAFSGHFADKGIPTVATAGPQLQLTNNKN